MGTIADLLNTAMRDFQRYTGDGLPNEPAGRPLPVGDPASGQFNPPKKQVRDAFLAIAGTADDLTEAVETAAASVALSEESANTSTVQAGISTAQAGIATTAASQANLAAIAAGAPIVTTLTDPVPANDSIELVKTNAGTQVWEVQTGAWVQIGWLGGPKFENVPYLLDDTSSTYGGDGTIVEAGGYHYAQDSVNGFIENGEGVKLRPLKAADGAYHTAALGPPSGPEQTDKLTAMLALAAGGTMVFDYFVGSYKTDRLIPDDNTFLKLAPGVTVEGISGGSRVLQVQCINFTLEYFGATIKRHPMQSSHPILISASHLNPCKKIRVRGGTVISNGSLGVGGTGENDCIYVGGAVQGVGGDPSLEAIPEDVIIEDCNLVSPRRNVVSIVAGDNVTVRNCKLNGEDAVVLRCAVDIEANAYLTDGTSAVKRVKVYSNIIRNCAGINLAVVFGDDVEFFDNDIEISVATASAIGGGAGGTQFNDAVYREGDRLGPTVFDAGTGIITVREGGDDTLHELGIHVGMWVQGVTKSGSGATFPSGLSTPFRYCISWISPDGTQIRLSTYYKFGEITSFGGAPTGTLDNDPTVSDLWFNVFRPGQCSNIKARDNKINYVGPAGAMDAFNVSTCYEWELSNNNIEMGLSTGQQVRATYGYGLTIKGVKGRGGVRGINAGKFSKVTIDDYTAKETTVDAYLLGGAFLLENSKAIACTGDILDITGGTDAVVRRFRTIRGATVASTGLNLRSGDDFRMEDSDFADAGSSIGTSISVLAAATNASIVRTKAFGGTIYGAGSKLYNPPSLKYREGVSTTVSAPGARLNRPVDVTFPINLQGVTVTAWVQANNVVGVRFQHQVADVGDLTDPELTYEELVALIDPIDLAEGTLSVACR